MMMASSFRFRALSRFLVPSGRGRISAPSVDTTNHAPHELDTSSLRLACQHNHRDGACGHRLILGEIGHHCDPFGEELIPFRAFDHGSSGLKAFGSDLNGYIGMGDDIVIPI